MTIEIDLRNLTKAHLEECKDNMETCTYASPCIVGTLIPKHRRQEADDFVVNGENAQDVRSLNSAGFLVFKDNQQFIDSVRLQTWFDLGDWDNVLEIAKKYVDQEVPA